MSESEWGGGDSLKDGMLFDGTELREMRDADDSFFRAFKRAGEMKRKRKKILQMTRKDVHCFPLIEYGQVLWICC
jgi:hypothetical protein